MLEGLRWMIQRKMIQIETKLLHFSEGSDDTTSIIAETSDTITVLKEGYYRLLEIKEQYGV